ncbi:MAG: ATP-binding protein [Acidimicrobiales bacterium]
MESWADLMDDRRQLYERFPVAPVGWSADGRAVDFVGPVTLGLGIGSLAIVDPQQGDGLIVVHVRDMRVTEREGSRAEQLASGDAADPGAGATITMSLRFVRGEGVVLGQLGSEGFASTTESFPFGEELIRPATADEVRAVMDAIDGDQPTIGVGWLRDYPQVKARLHSRGFSRHTFMCGQSGSGKTYTTGVLFERLLAHSTLPVLVLDPNSDHVHLGALADPDDRSPEAEYYRRVMDSVSVARARGLDSTFTLCVDFSDLEPETRAALLRLDPIADLDDYNALLQITAGLEAPYSVTDVAHAAAAVETSSGIARRIENLRLDQWGLWKQPGETSAVEADAMARRFVVADLGSLRSPDERTAVALAVLGNRWRARRRRQPALLAIDEAHNVLPANTNNPLLRAASETGVLIAGEGRKFGLHLFIASQRPGKVHPNVVSQCDNLILMRMNGVGDVADLEALFSHVPPTLLRESLTFGLGQALFAGRIAPAPLLAQIGKRLTPEGGSDVPTTWSAPPT